MRDSRQRGPTLLAARSSLERRLGELRRDGGSSEEIRAHLHSLARIRDELAVATSDPQMPMLMARWK